MDSTDLPQVISPSLPRRCTALHAAGDLHGDRWKKVRALSYCGKRTESLGRKTYILYQFPVFSIRKYVQIPRKNVRKFGTLLRTECPLSRQVVDQTSSVVKSVVFSYSGSGSIFTENYNLPVIYGKKKREKRGEMF